MTIASWLLISTIFWLAGFFNMWLLEPNHQSTLVYVPKWIFILFGAPKHKNVPATVQSAHGVYLQVMGLTMALYGIFLDQRIVKDPDLSALVGFGLSMLLGIIIAWWLYNNQPYKLEK